MSETDFIHRYLPGESGETILVLHGTGGSEEDLIPLARELASGAAILSPRGKVSEYGAARFFRRLAEGIFDHEDLLYRTHELANFVTRSASEYGLDPTRITVVGYSNGANIAASLLLLHPELISDAVLFRAMVPFEPEDALPDLSDTSIYIGAGAMDRMIPQSQTERLAEILTSSGANVELRWKNTGHGLTYEEVEEAKEWLAARDPAPGGKVQRGSQSQ